MGKNLGFIAATRLFLVVVAVSFFTATGFFCSQGCGGALSGLASEATSGDTASDGSASTLSDTESQLFEDGPVDLPVTVAKLDSPDLNLITVSVESLESLLVIPDAEYATTDTHRFTVTGAVGAAGHLEDGSFAPKFYLLNATTTESVLTDTGSDGSFVGTITGALTDTIVFASATSDGLQVSPVEIISVDAGGNVVVTTTNTLNLSTAQNLMTDRSGNYYFSVLNADGTTYSLLRRNLSGSQVDTISSTLPSLPRVVSSYDGTNVEVILESGDVMEFIAPAVTALTKSLSIPGVAAASESEWLSVTLDTISGGLPPIDLVKGAGGFQLLSSATNKTALMVSPFINVHTGENLPNMLNLIDLTGQYVPVVLVNGAEYDSAFVDRDGNGNVYVFLSTIGLEGASAEWTMYRFAIFDLDGTSTAVDAWQNRETLFNFPLGSVNWMDVSGNGDVVVSYLSADNFVSTAYWTESSGLSVIGDSSSPSGAFSNPRISSDGQFIVVCAMSSSDPLMTNLAVYFPGDTAGQITSLSENDAFATCDPSSADGVFIDSNDLVHFYKKPTDGSAVQLGLIDPRQHAAFSGISLPPLSE